MLSEYVGEEKFLKGVSIYLKAHLFANSDPVDLWNGIAEATGLDIAKMMDNWTWKVDWFTPRCQHHGSTLLLTIGLADVS